jgi:hypothetical protein
MSLFWSLEIGSGTCIFKNWWNPALGSILNTGIHNA